MKVCDICRNSSAYNTSVTYAPYQWKNVDLCGVCYRLLNEKEEKYKQKAFEELISERGDSPIQNQHKLLSWLSDKFHF